MGVQPRLDDLDVSSARLFLTVAELGSVSKAAARHGMSQPSATARIQKLERQIGLQLLQRGPTGSTVTDDGLRIAEWCASLVAAAGELTAGARSLREAGASHLHIAATATVARHLLSRWVASGTLETTHIDLTELSTVEVAHALREGTADIGFLDGPGAPLSLRSEIVAWVDLGVVVHNDHPWAGRRTGITGAQLAGAELILRQRGSGTRDVIESALAEYGLGAVGVSSDVSTSAAARLAAVNRAGIAILPLAEVAPDVAAGRLAVVPVRGLSLRQPVRVAWKGTTPPHPAARALLSTVRANPQST